MDQELDTRVLGDAPLTTDAPWFFRLGRFLSRRRLLGGDRLLSEARKRGFLDHLVVYTVGDIQVLVPLWRECNELDAHDVAAYGGTFVTTASLAIRTLPGRVTLIDASADIGLITAHLVTRCRNISAVFAFEGTRAAHAVLAQNVRGLPVRADARRAILGSFSGPGTRTQAGLVPDDRGRLAVERLDDLGIAPGGSLALRLVLDGSEADVIAGAARTIHAAGALVVAVETDPPLAAPLVRALRAIRNDRFTMITRSSILR